MNGREYITAEELHKHIDKFVCPRDFGFKTQYMKLYCHDGYCEGYNDCKKCWDSEVAEMPETIGLTKKFLELCE